MRTTLTLALALLAGCASTSRIHTADGKVGYSINCSGTARSWNQCYAKAGELCGSRGYNILTRDAEQGAFVSANSMSMVGSTTATRTMVVACKDP